MKINKLLFLFFVILFVALIKVEVKAADLKSVIFNELFWSGSFISSSDEFVELKNISSNNLDLSGWQITRVDSQGDEVLMLTISNGTIPVDGYFLIANCAKDHLFTKGESVLNIDPDLINSSLTLSNDKLQLKLYDGTWNDGREAIDVAGDGKAPLSGNNTSKSSMQRKNSEDGTQSANWQSTTDSHNLDMDSKELATPNNSGKPSIIEAKVYPEIIMAGDKKITTLELKVIDSAGIDNIKSATVDFASFGGNLYNLHDDGLNGDTLASDGIYFLSLEIDTNNIGQKEIEFAVTNKNNLVVKKTIPITIYESSDEILINEIFPNPSDAGGEEFIELYNSGLKDIDLYGWQIDDIDNGGSKPYILPESRIIKKGEFLILYKDETGVGLNDTGDTVRLIDPAGKEIDTISYKTAKDGYSYNRTDDGWKWSTAPTPLSVNVIKEPEIIDKTPKTESTNQGGFDLTPTLIPISQAQGMENGSFVLVEGTVNAIPGEFSSQYFYIQDASGGIQIYSYYKDFPKLSVGDKIIVFGELSEVTNGKRIKIKKPDDIQIVSHETELNPIKININEIKNDYGGKIVQINGKIIKSLSSSLIISDETGEITISIKNKVKIEKSLREVGAVVEIAGILVKYKGSWQLWIRALSDYRIIKNIIKDIDEPKRIVSVAKAEEPSLSQTKKENPQIYNDKAIMAEKPVTSSKYLIQISKTVIIISSILLILLIGERYVRRK